MAGEFVTCNQDARFPGDPGAAGNGGTVRKTAAGLFYPWLVTRRVRAERQHIDAAVGDQHGMFPLR